MEETSKEKELIKISEFPPFVEKGLAYIKEKKYVYLHITFDIIIYVCMFICIKQRTTLFLFIFRYNLLYYYV